MTFWEICQIATFSFNTFSYSKKAEKSLGWGVDWGGLARMYQKDSHSQWNSNQTEVIREQVSTLRLLVVSSITFLFLEDLQWMSKESMHSKGPVLSVLKYVLQLNLIKVSFQT